MRYFLFFMLFWVTVAALPPVAAAQQTGGGLGPERIERFLSEVTVRDDGVLEVVETIEVVARGDQILRGIYRDFPVRYETAYGFNQRVGFRVLSILRDGAPEPSHQVPGNAYLRTYIGDPDVHLQEGRYRYEIKYETDRQLIFRDGEDELFWNVTGHDWAFPIDRAEARITLPPGAGPMDVMAYTGPLGASGKGYRIVSQGAREVVLVTTAPLASGEGLSVSAIWPEGVVERPTSLTGILAFLFDNRGFTVGVLFLAGLIVYFLVTWWKIGRDPGRGTVIPLFEAPDGLSPFAAGIIWAGGIDGSVGAGRDMAVVLTSLATKGMIEIEHVAEGSYRITPVGGRPKGLPPGERALMRALFSGEDPEPVTLSSTYQPRVGNARNAMRNAIDGEFMNAYIRHNRGRWAIGLLLALATVFTSATLDAPDWEAAVMLAMSQVFSAVFTLALGILLGGWLFRSWQRVGRGDRPGIKLILASLAIPIGMVLPLFVAWLLLSDFAGTATAFLPPVALLLTVIFFHLLEAPTLKGRKTLDAIEGYRLYLSVAEEGRLNMAGEPPLTEAIFERHLPYAMALGVEEAWSDKFSRHLVASGRQRDRRYQPRWYQGLGPGLSAESLSSSLSRGLSSCASSAASAPSSSGGGSSSGGSSGGGGGGGGGGGW